MNRASMMLGVMAVLLAGVASARSINGQIPADQAARFEGNRGTVCGKVESTKYAQNAAGEPTFLHIGAAFPRQPFQVRINGADRGNFAFNPEEALNGKLICATGRILLISGRAEITVKTPRELALGS